MMLTVLMTLPIHHGTKTVKILSEVEFERSTKKNGSDPVPDFTTTISADSGPDSIYRTDAPASPGRPHILV